MTGVDEGEETRKARLTSTGNSSIKGKVEDDRGRNHRDRRKERQ